VSADCVAKISPGGIAGGDQWALACALQWVGWQPSRFLADRAETERASAPTELVGGMNAAAAELGMTWPSLRKAFTAMASAWQCATRETVR
jgi:hypothetical protein